LQVADVLAEYDGQEKDVNNIGMDLGSTTVAPLEHKCNTTVKPLEHHWNTTVTPL
jgi:hypothetical protein